MSTSNFHTCDRCGEPIRSGRLMLGVLGGRAPRGATENGTLGRPVIDLCPVCTSAFEEWLTKESRHANV